jgi:hypothetical protein
MRFLREASIAAMLLGCGDDSSGPAQPQVEGMSSGSVQNSSRGSGDAKAKDDDKGHKGQTRGFYVEGFLNGASVNIGTDFTEIQKFSSLPPGSYIANASAVLASSGSPEFHFVDCIFTIGGTIKGELARGVVGGTGSGGFVSLPLTIGFTISTTTDLGVACRTTAELGVVGSQGSPITAIRVDRLAIQP